MAGVCAVVIIADPDHKVLALAARQLAGIKLAQMLGGQPRAHRRLGEGLDERVAIRLRGAPRDGRAQEGVEGAAAPATTDKKRIRGRVISMLEHGINLEDPTAGHVEVLRVELEPTAAPQVRDL